MPDKKQPIVKSKRPSSIKSFEKSIQQLEQIVQQMENGELDLEQSLKQFEQGIKLAKSCHGTLAQAEQKIEQLIEQNGLQQTAPFDESDV